MGEEGEAVSAAWVSGQPRLLKWVRLRQERVWKEERSSLDML